LYSPTKPTTKTAPETSSPHSVRRSQNNVADSDMSVPIDPYMTMAAIGMALPGLALWYIAIKRYRNRK
jgi:hypothetical protein